MLCGLSEKRGGDERGGEERGGEKRGREKCGDFYGGGDGLLPADNCGDMECGAETEEVNLRPRFRLTEVGAQPA